MKETVSEVVKNLNEQIDNLKKQKADLERELAEMQEMEETFNNLILQAQELALSIKGM